MCWIIKINEDDLRFPGRKNQRNIRQEIETGGCKEEESHGDLSSLAKRKGLSGQYEG